MMAVWYNLAPTKGRGDVRASCGLAPQLEATMLPQDSTPAGKVCGVYVIENTVNGRVYIGSSVNIAVRWTNHRHRLNGERHENQYLQRAWTKYGPTAFTFRVVVETTAAERRTAEAATMRAYAQQGVYNSMEPSDGRSIMTHSAETRQRIGAKSLGHTLPADARRRISEARRGKPLSAEHRAKLSVAHQGKRPTQPRKTVGSFYGRKHTPEAIAKMRAAKLGKPRSPETIRKMSEAMKGRPVSAETRAKLIGRPGHPMSMETRAKLAEFRLTYVPSEETRRRIGDAQRGKSRGPMSAEHRAALSAAHKESWRRRKSSEVG